MEEKKLSNSEKVSSNTALWEHITLGIVHRELHHLKSFVHKQEGLKNKETESGANACLMQLHLLSFKIQQCQVLLCTAIHVSVQAEAWYQKKSWFISELLPVRAVRRLVNNLQNHNFKKWPCLSTATNSEVFFFFAGVFSPLLCLCLYCCLICHHCLHSLASHAFL